MQNSKKSRKIEFNNKKNQQDDDQTGDQTGDQTIKWYYIFQNFLTQNFLKFIKKKSNSRNSTFRIFLSLENFLNEEGGKFYERTQRLKKIIKAIQEKNKNFSAINSKNKPTFQTESLESSETNYSALKNK
jgi:hypothetical protein